MNRTRLVAGLCLVALLIAQRVGIADDRVAGETKGPVTLSDSTDNRSLDELVEAIITGDMPTHRAALSELYRSSARQKFTADQIQDATAQIYESWTKHPRTPDIIGSAWLPMAFRYGWMNETTARQWLGEAIELQLLVRPRVCKGDPIPVALTSRDARFRFGMYDSGFQSAIVVAVELDRLEVVGTNVVLQLDPPQAMMLQGNGRQTWLAPAELSPGQYRVRGQAVLHLPEVKERRFGIHGAALARPGFDPRWTVELEANVEVMPEDCQPVRPVRDPVLAGVMQHAVKITDMYGKVNGQAVVDIYVKPPPVPIVADLVIRADGREFPHDGPLIADGVHRNDGRFRIPVEDFVADDVTIILRPRLDIAAQTVDIERAWTETITLGPIPVTWYGTEEAKRDVFLRQRSNETR